MRANTTMSIKTLLKRLPYIGSLFLFFASLLLNGANAGWFGKTPENKAEKASLHAGVEHVRVKYVVDGDTIRLTDDQLVRLIGINAFELKGPQQRAGKAAKKALAKLLANKDITLKPGKQPSDSYGRLLAYVYADAVDVQAQMLKQGQAMVVAFAPNIEHIETYAKAELHARESAQGIWANSKKLQIDLTRPFSQQKVGELRGFAWIKARVLKVRETRKNYHLQLTDNLSVSIAKQDWKTYWPQMSASQFESQVIDVRGWVSTGFQNKQYLKVRHKAMLHIVEQ